MIKVQRMRFVVLVTCTCLTIPFVIWLATSLVFRCSEDATGPSMAQDEVSALHDRMSWVVSRQMKTGNEFWRLRRLKRWLRLRFHTDHETDTIAVCPHGPYSRLSCIAFRLSVSICWIGIALGLLLRSALRTVLRFVHKVFNGLLTAILPTLEIILTIEPNTSNSPAHAWPVGSLNKLIKWFSLSSRINSNLYNPVSVYLFMNIVKAFNLSNIRSFLLITKSYMDVMSSSDHFVE